MSEGPSSSHSSAAPHALQSAHLARPDERGRVPSSQSPLPSAASPPQHASSPVGGGGGQEAELRVWGGVTTMYACMCVLTYKA